MARDGLIPACFCRTSEARGTPINATLFQSIWASVLILSGSFEQLIIYSGTVLTIFSALAVGAVLILRRKEPDLPRPYRTPLYPFVPVFFILMSIVIIWNVLYERPLEGVMGLATVLAGTPLYFLWQKLRTTYPTPDSLGHQGSGTDCNS
jgi:APA family basic amino acid/polyamine antiporter